MNEFCGKIIHGRYEVLDVIGEGGFGVVYKGLDTRDNQPVAIKTVLPKFLGDPEMVRTFEQEARVVSDLNNKNIVQVVDFFPEGPQYFIVMEYVDGKDLLSLLFNRGYNFIYEEQRKQDVDLGETRFDAKRILLSFSTISEIVSQVCHGLTAAHAVNIYHCDLKPENILVSQDGVVKVGDFGIARIQHNLAGYFRHFQGISTFYASPEQFKNESVDQRSDIYSLGVVLYLLTTGRFPFWGNDSELKTQHLYQSPIPVTNLREDTPEQINNIILRCLEKKPDNRFESVQQLQDALTKCIKPVDVDAFLCRKVEEGEHSDINSLICPVCGSPVPDIGEKIIRCTSCANSFSGEEGETQISVFNQRINQILVELDIRDPETQTAIRNFQFKQFIYPRIEIEEAKAEKDFEYSLRDGAFAFPAMFHETVFTLSLDEIIGNIKEYNFLLYLWRSKEIGNYIIGTTSIEKKEERLRKISGRIQILLGMYYTLRASKLEKEQQSREYSTARKYFETARQILEIVDRRLFTTADMSVELCQIAEGSFRSPDNNRAAFLRFSQRLKEGSEWDKRVADNCERLNSRSSIRSNPLLGLFRANEDSIIVGDMPAIELLRVPGGEFLMGAEQMHRKRTLPINYSDNPEGDRVMVQEFLMSRDPITVAQFSFFLLDSGYKTTAEIEGQSHCFSGLGWKLIEGGSWNHPNGPGSGVSQKQRHPVTQVSLIDALEFCHWLSTKSKRKVILPTEAQWEKAARGTDQRMYPWGNQSPDGNRCNFNNLWRDTKPVGYFSRSETPQANLWGASRVKYQNSPYGCNDLAGNVWEWTISLHRPYPYSPTDGREALPRDGVSKLADYGARVIRGGAFDSTASELCCFVRRKMMPDQAYGNLGFRVVVI